MANIRLMPPVSGQAGSIQVNGRTYACAANSVVDVPDFDASVMMANGWTAAAAGGVGATAARPANPVKNQVFHDTTLNLNIVFDGKTWRNPATGAAA